MFCGEGVQKVCMINLVQPSEQVICIICLLQDGSIIYCHLQLEGGSLMDLVNKWQGLIDEQVACMILILFQ